MEEFGREMYKLFKTFNAKAKQLAKEKGAKNETGDVYAPVKITTSIQDQVKQFKVERENGWLLHIQCVVASVMY